MCSHHHPNQCCPPLSREEILYKYYEFSQHSTAVSQSEVCCSDTGPVLHPLQASLVIYELAWKLTRDNNELLW